jgi:hypothetical protein
MEINLDKTSFEINKEKTPQFVISNGWLYVDRNTAKHHPLFGSSGWIAFFRLILYVSPVVGILAGIERFSILNGQYTNLILFSFFIDFFLLFLSWLLASELANPEPQSLNYFFVYLICGSALFFITASIVTNMAYSSISQFDTLLVLHLYRDSFILVILAFYFTLSDRVNITYRHRTKAGSVFAKSLELTLFESSSDTLQLQNESVDSPSIVESPVIVNKPENSKSSNGNEVVDVVSINEINEDLLIQKQISNPTENFFPRLFALKKVLDDGLITEADYEEKKKLILNDL